LKYHGVDDLRIPMELWARIEATRKGFHRKGTVYEKLDQSAYLIHLLHVAVEMAERELEHRAVASRQVLTPEEAARLDWQR
jgi:hypothetical protein